MDVADAIVVLAGGVVEQVGSPAEIYDNPANDFVMSFLGPVTRLGGQLVRPHDVRLTRTPEPGGTEASVTRVVRLGFEVRVEAVSDGQDVWAQVSRATADALDLAPGDTVYFTPTPQAKSLAAASAA
jgi:sulfate transport system ATP-binding protein